MNGARLPAARHLLIVAHGSRRRESNEEVKHLARRVAELRGAAFDHVEAAFLELADPDIATGLARCVEAGALEIVIFPYFLAAGLHVAEDLPTQAARFSETHPEVSIYLAPHLGQAHTLPSLILATAAAGWASLVS